MTDPQHDSPTSGGLSAADRIRLEGLRYTAATEAVDYIAIMRVFTVGTAGLMSDLSAGEVAARLDLDYGIELDQGTVEQRLGYLTDRGNLSRSPRETRANTIDEYMRTRARFQLTATGEMTHRLVEELLGATDEVREVSTEMLGAIHQGLAQLAGIPVTAIGTADPDELASQIGTIFAQHRNLVESTRDFYSYLNQVLGRYDLNRKDFQVFKTVLIDYLQHFVEEIARHMPHIADLLIQLQDRIGRLVARANEGSRLVDISGKAARRSAGLQPEDWRGLQNWFLDGAADGGDRDSDAAQVRQLATSAMRALVVNLRRIVGDTQQEQSRQADLLNLARTFATSDDDTAHALWAAVFGLYPARHLGFAAAGHDEVPARASFWRTSVAQVPLSLVERGERTIRGKPAAAEDFTAVKAERIALRKEQEARRQAALVELAGHIGSLDGVRLSDEARTALLDLHTRALVEFGPEQLRRGAVRYQDSSGVGIVITPIAGTTTTITSPQGRMIFTDLSLAIIAAQRGSAAAPSRLADSTAAPSAGADVDATERTA